MPPPTNKPAAAPAKSAPSNGQPPKAAAATAAAGALMAKLGARLAQAHEAHKNDKTMAGSNMGLPAGITGGIARLQQCYFKQYGPDVKDERAGQYFFMAAGIVVQPVEFKGMRIAGMRTQIGPEPMCDTPKAAGKRKTLSDHLQWVYEHLRALGVKTTDLDPTKLESVAAALVKLAPYFAFETWTSEPTPAYPNPKINHKWGATVAFNQQVSPTGGFNDSSKPASATKPAVPPPPPPAPEPTPEEASAGEEAAGEEGGEYRDDMDIESLVTRSKNDDNEAQTRLREHATSLGWTEEQLDEAPDWDAIGEMAKAGPPADEEPAAGEEGEGEATGEEAPAEPQEFVPDVGSVYLYKVRDLKGNITKNPKTKKENAPIECECVAVNKNKTCNLKNMDDGKTIYKGVPFEHLENGQ